LAFKLLHGAVVATALAVAAPAVVLRPSEPGEGDLAQARAACGPEVFARTEPKQLNYVVRRWYLGEEARIGQLDAEWRREGRTASERARLAHELRRQARLTARRRMRSPREVALLCERDLRVYGDPNGPAFEWALRHAMAQLHAQEPGEAVYDRVVQGAQRSSALATAAASIGGVYEWAWNGFREEVGQ
jgi:hypothetical protein